MNTLKIDDFIKEIRKLIKKEDINEVGAYKYFIGKIKTSASSGLVLANSKILHSITMEKNICLYISEYDSYSVYERFRLRISPESENEIIGKLIHVFDDYVSSKYGSRFLYYNTGSIDFIKLILGGDSFDGKTALRFSISNNRFMALNKLADYMKMSYRKQRKNEKTYYIKKPM